MGYSFMAVAISADSVKQLFGSKNDAAFERMANPSVDYTRFLMELKEAKTSDRLDAFREILDGVALTNFKPYIYAYSIEAYCYEFGEALGEVDTRDDWRIFEFCHRQNIRGFSLIDYVGTDWPIPIPAVEDYPLSSWFDPDACLAMEIDLKRIKQELPEADDWEETNAVDAIETYLSWFSHEEVKRHGLVVFNH